jgi:hypothetical protein
VSKLRKFLLSSQRNSTVFFRRPVVCPGPIQVLHDCKLFVIVVGLMLVLPAGIAGAQEQNADKTSVGDRRVMDKCWQRVWVISEALKGRSTEPVCKAFERVLNTTCEQPDRLPCNWTLPPGEKQFRKLKWKRIDTIEHKDLIEEMVFGKDRSPVRWNTKDPEFRRAFESNAIDIKQTLVDIDGDEVRELLVHESWRHECPARGWFGVMEPKTKRLDWRYEHVLSDTNASEGAEVMLHNGKAYMFGWDRDWKIVMVYEGFYVHAVNARGNINICQFKYVKEDKR